MKKLTPILLPTLLAAAAAASLPAGAAQFVRRAGDVPLRFTVPAEGTTMIAIPGDPIRSAVYDKATMDVQTESASGQVYVLPRRIGPAMIYLTSESGETAPLELTFAEDAEPQTIILEKRPDAAGSAAAERGRPPLRPLRAEGFSAEIKRFVTLILRNEPADEVEKTRRTTPGPAAARALEALRPLTVKFEGVWRSAEAEAYCATLRNGTISPVVLDPEALTSGSLWAAALTKTALQPGETAVLILVEAPREH